MYAMKMITYFASEVNGILHVGTINESVTELCFRKQCVIFFWYHCICIACVRCFNIISSANEMARFDGT